MKKAALTLSLSFILWAAAGSSPSPAFGPGTGEGGSTRPGPRDHGGGGELSSDISAVRGVMVNGVLIAPEKIAMEARGLKRGQGLLHGSVSDGSKDRVFLDRAVDKLVGRELLVQEAKAAGLSVPPAEFDKAWSREQTRWGDNPDSFAKSLEIRGGISEEYLREKVREDLLIGVLIREKIEAAVDLTEEAQRAYYESNRNQFTVGDPVLRYAFFSSTPVEGRESGEARRRILFKKLKQGESFGDLARTYSDDPSAARRGAVDGPPEAPPPFYDEGLKLRPSQFTNPLHDDRGWHIYFREARSTVEPLPLEEVRDDILARLMAEGRQAGVTKLLADLKAGAEITFLE